MNLTVETKENELIIKIPNIRIYNPERIQQILDYIRYISNLEKGVNDVIADQLAEEIMEDWWKKNKSEFLNKFK